MGDDTQFPVLVRSRAGRSVARHWTGLIICILAVAAVTDRARGQWVAQCIKSFGSAPLPGYPHAGLIQGADGAFYGTTTSGGSSNSATVFRLSASGDSCTVLHSFGGVVGKFQINRGPIPNGELLQGADGALYGAADVSSPTGGSGGMIFKLASDGTGFTVLHNFSAGTGFHESGPHPNGGLIQGRDGELYGTTMDSGTNGFGTVFRLSPNGTNYTVLYTFTGQDDGATPYAGVIQGMDGALYGTTSSGGTRNLGTVFKLATDGTGYTVLYRFADVYGEGSAPYGRLLQASDGTLYGTTRNGGSNGFGTVFRIGTDCSGYAVICSLTPGALPTAGLCQGPDGALYGLGSGNYSPSQLGSLFQWDGFLFKVNTDGSGYAVLHNFTGAGSDGIAPYGPLLLGSDGVFYGTTYAGGTNGFGTVFKVATNGTDVSTIYNFAGTGRDGTTPAPGLLQGADGALYGVTTSGGISNLGTVFRMNTDGTGYAVLHSFTGTIFSTSGDSSSPNGLMQGVDGVLYGTTGVTAPSSILFSLNTNGSGYTVLCNFPNIIGCPTSSLVQGPDGMLYGTSTSSDAEGNCVFKVGTNGTGFSVLYNLTANGGLLIGSDGALYGTTAGLGYGTNDPTYQPGTVFKLNTDGTGFTILCSLVGGTGVGPQAGLIQGSDGALYGNTFGGGPDFAGDPADWGTVFKLNIDGSSYTVIHNFAGTATDAGCPQVELVQGHDGEIYGTTSLDGANTNGTVFKLSTDGTDYELVYSFPPSFSAFLEPMGSGGPVGSLVAGSDGALYGTTRDGGTYGYGSVYRLVYAPPPRFADLTRMPDGSNRLTICGTSNLVWRVQVATNLQSPVAWMPLASVVTTNGSAQFIDPGAKN